MLLVERWTPLLLLLLLGATAFIFWPALSGPFLLDDNLHLPKLGGYDGSIDTLREFFELVFSGSSATGRPLSFLSLLINDNSWPTVPWGFKYTNLMLHLLNGVLVFILIRTLSNILERHTSPTLSSKSNIVALVATAIWLLHPIHLSTMMMVIQRMTLLMATFTLLGLITYLKGRITAQTKPLNGYALMSLGIAGFGTLGVLCKEPAAMIVCYVIALELTLLHYIDIKRPPYWKSWFSIFILAPLAIIVIYYVAELPRMNQLYLKRPFDLEERLLTESRVLIDYLRVIFLPSLSQTGPYHDDYIISRGLLEPISTLWSISFIGFSMLFAVIARHRFPLIAFSIIWFFLAHSLESTILPLELYFEHRNYLPMLGFVFALIYWGVNTKGKLSKVNPVFFGLFLLLEGSISAASSRVWGSSALIANIWAYEHPNSPRAQIDAIRYWAGIGDPDKILHHFELAQKSNPKDAGLYMYRFIIDRCSKQGAVNLNITLRDLEQIIPTAHFEHASLEGIQFLLDHSSTGRCRITDDELIHITDLYLANRLFAGNDFARGFLYQQRSHIFIKDGDLDKTIEALDHQYEAMPRYGIALNQAYLLASAGLYDDAARYIEIAKRTKPYNFYVRLWQQDHISEIEASIGRLKERNNGIIAGHADHIDLAE